MTFAVDFDGTLSFGPWPSVGPANTKMIKFLLKRKAKGDKIILWTCRAGDALVDAINWCQEQGIEFDCINDNLPEVVEKYGVNSRKISCDYYIDDKAITTNFIDLLEVTEYGSND